VETAATWRDLLGTIIQDSQERQRVVRELGVSGVTLTRWVSGTSNPRMQSLRRLLEVLPQENSQLMALIAEEFTDFLHVSAEELQEETQVFIPSTFYGRVFDAYTSTPKIQRFWTISNLILQQALEQLDPLKLGMAITIVQCMPPWDDNAIYSLRERAGHGTDPWRKNLEQYAIFLGAESLAGNVVLNSRPRVLQSREEYKGILPAHWVEKEQSAAGYPLLRSNQIAGCLLVSSTKPGYFTDTRLQLIQYYAELLSFVFEPREFYDLEQIKLRTMPYYRWQERYLNSFRQRVSQLMIEAVKEGRSLSLLQAEQAVWQHIERDLLTSPIPPQEAATELRSSGRSFL
jgi:transcriptional regulator with XRE-family HTH domain